MTSSKDQVAELVGIGTVAIGTGQVLAPTVAGRFWGFAPDAAPVVPHLIRLYGLSLVSLGVTSLITPAERDGMMRVASGTAAATAIAGLVGGLRGRVSARSALMTVATAGGLAALAGSAVGKA